MTDQSSNSVDKIDALVGAYLCDEESRTDAGSLLERIRADRRIDAARKVRDDASPGYSFLRRVTWGMTMAGVILITFLGGRSFHPESANASILLKNVKSIHAQDIDRCYRVQHASANQTRDDGEVSPAASECLLWTRGDRFWSDCVIGETRLTIGRDAAGTLWLAPSRDKGIRFSPLKTEFPKEIETICQIGSLTVPILIDDVLADFDLETHGPALHTDGDHSLVWARLKPDRTHPFLSAALLEIDAETDVLVRLVLWMHDKQKAPTGTVTYTLIDRPAPGDASYQLKSHLDEGAVIEDHSFQAK